MSKLFLSLMLSVIASAAPAVRQEMLVSTDWLAQHLSDPKVVILHVGGDRALYDAGHIPGARYLAFTDIAITRDGVLNELRPAADLKRVFEQVGVSDNTRVIVYSDAQVLPATRAFFTLDYLGHADHVALLDGGLGKWTRESRRLSKETPVIRIGNLTLRVRPQVVVGIEAMRDLSRAAVNDPSKSAVLLDVRPAKDFMGVNPAAEPGRAGHIPGAVNMYWTEPQVSQDDSTLKPTAEMRKIYDSVGVSPDRPVVTYCNSGVSATQSYFTLRYLGYNVSMYDGSYSQWSKAQDAPVAK